MERGGATERLLTGTLGRLRLHDADTDAPLAGLSLAERVTEEVVVSDGFGRVTIGAPGSYVVAGTPDYSGVIHVPAICADETLVPLRRNHAVRLLLEIGPDVAGLRSVRLDFLGQSTHGISQHLAHVVDCAIDLSHDLMLLRGPWAVSCDPQYHCDPRRLDIDCDAMWRIAVTVRHTNILKGVVVDENGDPCRDVDVRPSGAAEGTRTDPNGRFSLAGARQPCFLDVACDSGMHECASNLGPFPVGSAELVTIVVHRKSACRLKVTGPQGALLTGSVSIFRSGNVISERAMALGVVDLPWPLMDGDRLLVRSTSFPGVAVSDAWVEEAKRPGERWFHTSLSARTYAVTVVDDRTGSAVVGALVQLVAGSRDVGHRGQAWRWLLGSMGTKEVVQGEWITDAAGSVWCKGSIGDSCDLLISAPGYESGRVELADGAVVVCQLRRALQVQGTVAWSRSAGSMLRQLRFLRMRDGAARDADIRGGEFTVAGVTEDDYKVVLMVGQDRTELNSIELGTYSVREGHVLQLDASNVVLVRVDIASDAQAARGLMPGDRVSLVPVDRRGVRLSTRVAPNGRASLKVVPGRYCLVVRGLDSSSATERSTATLVEVGSAATQELTSGLYPGRMRLRVVGPSGVMSGTWLQLPGGRMVCTDAKGEADLDDILGEGAPVSIVKHVQGAWEEIGEPIPAAVSRDGDGAMVATVNMAR